MPRHFQVKRPNGALTARGRTRDAAHALARQMMALDDRAFYVQVPSGSVSHYEW